VFICIVDRSTLGIEKSNNLFSLILHFSNNSNKVQMNDGNANVLKD
jgi:hypothetical protein